MAILFLVGRILFGGYFLKNAYGHLFKSSHMIGYAQSMGVPSPKIAILGSGILLAIGGLSIIFGAYQVYGVIALAIFLILVSFKMHAFWKIQDPMARMGERIQFEKNMALLGGAIMLLAIATPWVYSF